MNILLLLPSVLSSLLLGAHFLRAGQLGPVAFALLMPLLLFIRRSWIPKVFGIFLISGAAVWAHTAHEVVLERLAAGRSYGLSLGILTGVAGVTLASLFPFRTVRLRTHFSLNQATAWASAAVFSLIVGLLGFLSYKLDRPILLPDRFAPGSGWILIFGVALWGAWLVEKMLAPGAWAQWRRRLWLLFSVVFFAQLAIGLAGVEQFLMTGELHLPVPAMIVAGPIYRGGGFFMPILFVATTLLVGPAWCSYLCYLGAWDNYASLARKKPLALPGWSTPVRVGLLALVVLVALGLRVAGVASYLAAMLGLAFGMIAVVVMLAVSRKWGAMVHCAVYCPMGLLADLVGRLSPFRVKVGQGCNDCGACTPACRYGALGPKDISRRRPGFSCTLCGDCLDRCRDGQLTYSFIRMNPGQSRTLFAVMVVVLHGVFLAVARI